MSNEAEDRNGEEEFSESRKLILQMAATLMAGRTADKFMDADAQSKALRAASQMVIATKPSKYIYLHNLFSPEETLPSNQIAKRISNNKWPKLTSKNPIDDLLEMVRSNLDTGDSSHAVDVGLTYLCRNLQIDEDCDNEIAAIRKSLLDLNKKIYIPSTNQGHTSDTHTTESVSSDGYSREHSFYRYLTVNLPSEDSHQAHKEKHQSTKTLIRPYYLFFYCLHLAEQGRADFKIESFRWEKSKFHGSIKNTDTGDLFGVPGKAPDLDNQELYGQYWSDWNLVREKAYLKTIQQEAEDEAHREDSDLTYPTK